MSDNEKCVKDDFEIALALDETADGDEFVKVALDGEIRYLPGDGFEVIDDGPHVVEAGGSEAFALFEALIAHLREAVTAQLVRVEIVPPEEPQQLPEMAAHKLNPTTGEDEFALSDAPVVPKDQRNPNDPSTWGKIGRNEDCPCGSGKKYKHCHGRYA